MADDSEELKEFEGGIKAHRDKLNKMVRKVKALEQELKGGKGYSPTRFDGCKDGKLVVYEVRALLVTAEMQEDEEEEE